jgi:hypothetical protein
MKDRENRMTREAWERATAKCVCSNWRPTETHKWFCKHEPFVRCAVCWRKVRVFERGA